MVSLSVEIRDAKKQKAKDRLPAVLYGSKIKNMNLEVDSKEFDRVYGQAGESSLVSLKVGGQKDEFLVLIHDIQRDPISGKPVHVDFYQPDLKKEVESAVPLVFEGESLAVKELGGTLVKQISEIDVKALPQSLPREIRVDISGLKTFEDVILVKHLNIPSGVEVLKEPEEIVASVSEPEKVEEELEKPIEEGKEPELVKEEKEEAGEEKKEEKPAEQEKEQEKKE